MKQNVNKRFCDTVFCGLPLKSLTYIDTRCIYKITAETRSHCILENIQLQSRSCKDLVSALFCSISFIWSSTCSNYLCKVKNISFQIKNTDHESVITITLLLITTCYFLPVMPEYKFEELPSLKLSARICSPKGHDRLPTIQCFRCFCC